MFSSHIYYLFIRSAFWAIVYMKNRDNDNNKNGRLFGLFTPKNITKDDEYAEIPTNFKGFFVMLGRKFWNISNLSLLYSFMNLPFLFLLLGYSLREPVTVVSGPMTASFYGFWNAASGNEALSALFPVVGVFGKGYVYSTASYICFGIAALTFLTFGISNAGCANIIRSFNRGDPVFLVSDFFGTIKRNWKQALVIGVIDIIFSFLLVYDYLFWISQPGFMGGMLMYFALFLCVLYFFMRFYIYTIMITFDLSVYKIFKDAFLLSFLGFKRNILALIGIIVLFGLNMTICSWFLPIGIMLPIILTLALGMFISGYASYPVIRKYMIDPYFNEESEEDQDDDDEPLFEDRG